MGPLCIISFTSTIALLKYNSYATPLSHLKHITHWFWYIQICGTITTINYKDIVMSPPPQMAPINNYTAIPPTWSNHSFPLSLQNCLLQTFHINGNHITHGPLCLVSFLYHHVFKSYPCSVCQDFIFIAK